MTEEEKIMFEGFKYAMSNDQEMEKDASIKTKLLRAIAGNNTAKAGVRKAQKGAQKIKDVGTYFKSGYKGTNPGRPASKMNFRARNMGNFTKNNKKELAWGAGGAGVVGGASYNLSE